MSKGTFQVPNRVRIVSRTVGLVIPAYEPDVDRLRGYLESIRETGVVDVIHVELDDPTGSTPEIGVADSINRVDERRGKGAAIVAGFDTLSTDVLAFADADGATATPSFLDVVEPVRDGSVGLAVGSRRHPDATITSHQTVLRRRLGDVFAWLARRLLAVPLYDYQCGAKAVGANEWAEIRRHMHESGFAWDLEFIAVADALGYDIREVPITWDDSSDSTVNPIRTPIEMAIAMGRIRRRVRPLQYQSRSQTATPSESENSTSVGDE